MQNFHSTKVSFHINSTNGSTLLTTPEFGENCRSFITLMEMSIFQEKNGHNEQP